MDTVKPRLRLALLCSHVDPDPDGVPFSLHAPIHTLVMPIGGRPYRPPALALYTQLEDAAGTFGFSVHVRNEDGFVTNPGAPVAQVTFPPTRYRAVPLEQVFHLDVTFPRPGVYFVHLMCNHRSLHEPGAEGDGPFPAARVNVIAEEGFRAE